MSDPAPTQLPTQTPDTVAAHANTTLEVGVIYADKDKQLWQEHSILLNQLGWRMADALGYIDDTTTHLEADIEGLVDELIAKAARD